MKKSYVYADGQILCQYNGETDPNLYFYVHDRLGSVRLVIDETGTVKNSYTYTPFGEMFPTECNETVYNPFKFTGQWFDSEIGQYYLRARMYDPVLMRLTSIDPVRGKFNRPMTLHPYLYCINDPINHIDPSGKVLGFLSTSNLRAKIAGAGLAARMGVDRFVNTLNLRSYWLDAKLAASDSYDMAIWGAVKVNELFANVAQYGWKAVAAVGTTLATWQTVDPGGPVEFPAALLGDPHPPTSVSGAAGVAIHELLKELWEDRTSWWQDSNNEPGS